MLRNGIGTDPVPVDFVGTKIDSSVARKHKQKVVCTSTSSPWFQIIGRPLFIFESRRRHTPSFQALSHAPTPIPARPVTARKLAQSQSLPRHGRLDSHMVTNPTVEIYPLKSVQFEYTRLSLRGPHSRGRQRMRTSSDGSDALNLLIERIPRVPCKWDANLPQLCPSWGRHFVIDGAGLPGHVIGRLWWYATIRSAIGRRWGLSLDWTADSLDGRDEAKVRSGGSCSSSSGSRAVHLSFCIRNFGLSQCWTGEVSALC